MIPQSSSMNPTTYFLTRTLGWNIQGLIRQMKHQISSGFLAEQLETELEQFSGENRLPHYIHSVQKVLMEDQVQFVFNLNPSAFPIKLRSKARV
jgi:hypothetical protein